MKKQTNIFSKVPALICMIAVVLIGCKNSGSDTRELASNETAITVEGTNQTAKYAEPAIQTVLDEFNPDFFYGFGTRFSGIVKADLTKPTAFADYIAEEHAQRIISYKSLEVIIIENDERTDKRIGTKGGLLTTEQINFLQSLPYSTNFLLWAEYTERSFDTGEIQDSHWTPHLTMVPEKQAEYVNGNDAIINYLKQHTKEETTVLDKDNMRPAKLYFTVTKEGTISDVNLDFSCGMPLVDTKVKDLITNLPGKWVPAENESGERVDQEFVISFGLIGC